MFLGGPVLLADLDLLALGDSVSNLNHLGGQEIGLSLSRARISGESRRGPHPQPGCRTALPRTGSVSGHALSTTPISKAEAEFRHPPQWTLIKP